MAAFQTRIVKAKWFLVGNLQHQTRTVTFVRAATLGTALGKVPESVKILRWFWSQDVRSWFGTPAQGAASVGVRNEPFLLHMLFCREILGPLAVAAL